MDIPFKDLPKEILEKVKFVKYSEFYKDPEKILPNYDPRICAQNIILCYNKDRDPCILLTQRANGNFAGNIEPPGGKMEDDFLLSKKRKSFQQLVRIEAERESFEEIKFKSSDAKHCGFLSHDHTYNKPGVAINYFFTVIDGYDFNSLKADKDEVNNIYLLPLKHLFNTMLVSEQRAYDINDVRKLVAFDETEQKFFNITKQNDKYINGTEVPVKSIIVIEDNVVAIRAEYLKPIAKSKKPDAPYPIIRDGEALIDAIHIAFGKTVEDINMKMVETIKAAEKSKITGFEIVGQKQRDIN